MGSYGSTICAPARDAVDRGMFFWETGAVGMLGPESDQGRPHLPGCRPPEERRACSDYRVDHLVRMPTICGMP